MNLNTLKKKALITGITGQDGSYLTEFLLKKKYEVHGIIRRSSNFNTKRLDHLYQGPEKRNKNLFLHYGDMTDGLVLTKLIHKIKPNEIYNLAAQSHVRVSFDTPDYTSNVNALGTLRLLEAVRLLKINTKIYQASTSEQFGNYSQKPLSEKSFFDPKSPYAASKVFAHHMIKIYRESYKMYCCSGIMFNHESERRGETFVTQKIINGLKNIINGKQKFLILGNLYAYRDWGYAPEYIEIMWKMLQRKKPEDFIISTGQNFSVKEFIELSSKELGFKIKWIGKGLNEVGLIEKIINGKLKKIHINQKIIKISKIYFRPNEVDYLLGDSKLAKKKMNWKPKIRLNQLIKKMINNSYL